MKQNYEAPEIEIIIFDSMDVISASSDGTPPGYEEIELEE